MKINHNIMLVSACAVAFACSGEDNDAENTVLPDGMGGAVGGGAAGAGPANSDGTAGQNSGGGAGAAGAGVGGPAGAAGASQNSGGAGGMPDMTAVGGAGGVSMAGGSGGAPATGGNGGGAGASQLDPQVPPADATKMAEWLQAWADNNWEAEWVCESEATAKTEGIAGIHVHNDAAGKNRVCSNTALAEAEAMATLPEGAAAVKFVDEKIYVEVKVAADSDGGNGWYWYAPGGSPEGTGLAACIGCHGQAGADADHPGFGDYVYFQVAK